MAQTIIYYGIFIDKESKNKLKSLVPRTAYKVYCDHMTLAHSSTFTDEVVNICNGLLGKEFTITATTIGKSKDVMAVGIETDCFSVNNNKHITLCTLTSSSKPVQSNYIENWKKLKNPIVLKGTVMAFTNNGLIKENKTSTNMKRRIRLTEGDLHRIVKESVNRILTESKNSKRARQQAIAVARRTIRGNVPDPIIERYVREFEENYMQGCPDYLYKFLPKFVEIAFKSKTREEYKKVGEIVSRLVNMSRARWTLTNEKYRSEFEKINAARTAEDLEAIYNTILNSKEEPKDTWNRNDMYDKHNYVNDRGELRDNVWLDDYS